MRVAGVYMGEREGEREGGWDGCTRLVNKSNGCIGGGQRFVMRICHEQCNK